MRAVIYARYSSDNQREASIEDQVHACRTFIEREGWQYLIAYSDHAASGASSLRPGYQKLLEDARAGSFDVIVAEALDRLSRDQADTASLYKQLTFLGIRLVTLAEGDISELQVGLKGTMNAIYLKDLAQKTRRGLEGRVRQGRSAGGLCYGYDVVREIAADGQAVAGGRTINEREAAVVRRIFTEFAAGTSPRAIARRLNTEGIAGPGGRPWSDTTIRGHATRRTGILHNDLYVGRLIWNKQRYVKDPATGKRLARVNPESAWIVREIPDLRILPQDLWGQVQERLGQIRQSPRVQKARDKRFWEHRRPKHLLTGLARCALCDGTMTTVGRHYLACSTAHRKGTCSNKQSMPRDVLENVILEALKRDLMEPDMVKEFVAAVHAEINRSRRDREQAVDRTRGELRAVTRKLDQLIEAIAEGLRSPGLQQKLDELESRKQALEQQLAAAPAPAPRLHPNLAELYRLKVADLHQALHLPATRDEAMAIVRSLIERVVLHPIEGGYKIELIGEIAKMVEAALQAADRKKAAILGEDAACSIKVVAGAGFEPATFRL